MKYWLYWISQWNKISEAGPQESKWTAFQFLYHLVQTVFWSYRCRGQVDIHLLVWPGGYEQTLTPLTISSINLCNCLKSYLYYFTSLVFLWKCTFLRRIIHESVIHQRNIVWTSFPALLQSDSWGRTGLFSMLSWQCHFSHIFPLTRLDPLCRQRPWFWLLSDHFIWTYELAYSFLEINFSYIL